MASNIILRRAVPIPSADLKTQAKAAGLAIYSFDSNGNITGLLDPAGNSATLIPSFTLATLPNAALMRIGSEINIPKSEFLNNTGMPAWGINLKSDGVNWITAQPNQIFSMQDGDASAPLISAWTQGGGTAVKAMMPLTGGNPTIPWQLMHIGLRVRLSAEFRFVVMATGSTSAIFGITFSKNNNSNSVFANFLNVSYAAGGKTIKLASEVYVYSPTAYKSSQIVPNHVSATTADQYPVNNTSSLDWSTYLNHYVGFCIDPTDVDTTAKYDLLNYKIELIS